jgi:hypothetical protein
MKAKEYRIITDCIERGVEYGYNRAYKHGCDAPTVETLKAEIERAVINEICEYFNFEDDDGNHSL